jgi:small conductance mechanosensitive channel
MIIQNPLTNYSLVKKRRINLKIGVSYNSDLNQVKEVTVATVKQIPAVDTSKGGILIDFDEFGDSAITFTLRFWIGKSGESDYNSALAQAIMAITEVYRKNNINIPFPIRTVQMMPEKNT